MDHHNIHNNTASLHWSYGGPVGTGVPATAGIPTAPTAPTATAIPSSQNQHQQQQQQHQHQQHQQHQHQQHQQQHHQQHHHNWGVPPPQTHAHTPTNAAGHAVKRPMSESDCEDLYSEESSKEQISPNDAAGSCQLMSRKKRRGVIEKKRRDRINSSLSELKRLVPTAFEKQGSAKLEKAEILQLTVEHLKNLQSKGVDTLSYDPQRFAMDYHIIGFRECAAEVARYLVTIEGMDIQDPLRLRLMSHLQYFVQQRELSAKGCTSSGGCWSTSAAAAAAAAAGYQTNCAVTSYQAYPTTHAHVTGHGAGPTVINNNELNTSYHVGNLPATSGLHQYPATLSVSPNTAHLQATAQHQQQTHHLIHHGTHQQTHNNGRSTSSGPGSVQDANTLAVQQQQQQHHHHQQQQQQQQQQGQQGQHVNHETHHHHHQQQQQQQQQQHASHYTHDHSSHHATSSSSTSSHQTSEHQTTAASGERASDGTAPGSGSAADLNSTGPGGNGGASATATGPGTGPGPGTGTGVTYIDLTTQNHSHRDASGHLAYHTGLPTQYPPTVPTVDNDYNTNTGVYVSANGSKPYRPWGAEMAY